MTTSFIKKATLAFVSTAAFAACSTLKTPTLQVEGVHLDRVRVTGAGVGVNFLVQNPNPEPLVIERFEYELKLNGHRLGRGYHTEPIRLDGFRDERLQSRFGLNFLSLPGAVRGMLDDNRANVQVSGNFYVRRGGDLKKMGFSNSAHVDLGR